VVSPMLLILASEDDSAAQSLARAVERAGQLCAITWEFANIDLTAQCSRSGSTSVKLSCRKSGNPITGVVNRLCLPPERAALDFLGYERIAVWWAALAHFRGPVVNRPSPFGVLPTESFLRSISRDIGFVFPQWFLSTNPSDLNTVKTALFLSMADGQVIGTSPITLPFRAGEVFEARTSDLRNLKRILIAGRDAYLVGTGFACLDAIEEDFTAHAVTALVRTGPYFIDILLEERTAGKPVMVKMNCFPSYELYAHAEQLINESSYSW
jgi:hypothetical protein